MPRGINVLLADRSVCLATESLHPILHQNSFNLSEELLLKERLTKAKPSPSLAQTTAVASIHGRRNVNAGGDY